MAAESFMKRLRRITWKTEPRTAALFGWSVLCSDNVDSHSVCCPLRSAQGQTGPFGASAWRWRLLGMQATQGAGGQQTQAGLRGIHSASPQTQSNVWAKWHSLESTFPSAVLVTLSHSLCHSLFTLFFPHWYLSLCVCECVCVSRSFLNDTRLVVNKS